MQNRDMTRREFSRKALGTVAALSSLGSVANACASLPTAASIRPDAGPLNPQRTAELSGDDMAAWRAVAQLARLAPTPHNTQPFRIRPIDARTAEIVALGERFLPAEDHGNLYMASAFGIMAATIEMAARAQGLEARVSPVASLDIGALHRATSPTLLGTVTLVGRDDMQLQIPRFARDDKEARGGTQLQIPRSARDDTQLQIPRSARDDTQLQIPRSARDDTQLQIPRSARDDNEARDDTQLQIPRYARDDTQLQIPRYARDDSELQIPRSARDDNEGYARDDHQLLHIRRTSRIPYDGRLVPAETWVSLAAAVASHGHELIEHHDRAVVERTLRLNADALLGNLHLTDERREIQRWYRLGPTPQFGDGLWEKPLNQDSFEVKLAFGSPGIFRLPIARQMARRDYLATQRGTRHVLLLRGPFQAWPDLVDAGRALFGLWIGMAQAGVYMQPMGSMLTNPRYAAEIARRFNVTDCWLVMRAGYSAEPPRAPRLQSILI